MLATPSLIASSVSAERDHWSHSRRIGESTEARSRSPSSESSPSRGQDSHGERCCARSRSGGRATGLASLTLDPRAVRRALDGICHAPLLPACGLGSPGRGLRTPTGPVGFSRTLGVTVCGLVKCARVRLAITGSSRGPA